MNPTISADLVPIMRLHLDIFSGLAGDMFIGALLDLGIPFPKLEAELRRLGVGGYHLHHRRASKSGIEGVKFDVHLESGGRPGDHHHVHRHGHEEAHGHAHGHGHGHDHTHHHHHHDGHDHGHSHGDGQGHPDHGRTYAEIRDLIAASTLGDWVKRRSIAVFDRIAVAEGKIHGKPPSAVHFHEVGAVDSIVDVVGACVALDLLGRPTVTAGPVVEGTGFVRCEHGRMPLPAPATLEILAARGVTVTQCEEPHELLTPTGAALLAEFAESFAPLAGMLPRRIGYGVGTRDNQTRPNVVRAVLGDPAPAPATPPTEVGWESDSVAVLETNLDDVPAEILGHFVEHALTAGALDVFHTPIQMKKNRPGVLLTILCAPADADRFTRMMLTETSAFGVRRTDASRRKLAREFRQVATPHGEVTVKLGLLAGSVVHASPEYESCRQVAATAGVSLKTVYEAALRASIP